MALEDYDTISKIQQTEDNIELLPSLNIVLIDILQRIEQIEQKLDILLANNDS